MSTTRRTTHGWWTSLLALATNCHSNTATPTTTCGKEFTQDEMIDRRDELLDGPESWMNMLTLQEQFEILTQAGYDVELAQYRCVEEAEWLMEYGDIVDPGSIDLTLGGGLGEDGWDYGWRRRNRG